MLLCTQCWCNRSLNRSSNSVDVARLINQCCHISEWYTITAEPMCSTHCITIPVGLGDHVFPAIAVADTMRGIIIILLFSSQIVKQSIFFSLCTHPLCLPSRFTFCCQMIQPFASLDMTKQIAFPFLMSITLSLLYSTQLRWLLNPCKTLLAFFSETTFRLHWSFSAHIDWYSTFHWHTASMA